MRLERGAGLCLLILVLVLAACSPGPEPLGVATLPAEILPAQLPDTSTPAVTPTGTIAPTVPVQPTSTSTSTPTATPNATPTAIPLPPTITPSPLPTPCAQTGRIEHGFFNTALAGPLGYRVYLPPCYGLDGHVYPVLYLLGGNVHDDSIWDVLGADEAAETGILVDDLSPFLIVMPDGGWVANQTSGGPGSYEMVILNELIPTIEQTYCAWSDGDGRAIGGLSRGGYWALEIAFRNPQVFHSVGGHSVALVDSHAGPGVDPVQTAGTNDLNNLRIYLDLGESDPYLVQARPLHEALTAAGVEHVWQINEGGHENAYWTTHLPEYLAWYNEGWALDRALLPLCGGPG